jgi:hypothetical protein
MGQEVTVRALLLLAGSYVVGLLVQRTEWCAQ